LSTLLKAVFSRPTSKIDLTFDNKVVMTFRSSQIDFLKGLNQSQVEDIVVQDKGTMLYWPGISKSIKVSDLLERLVGG
jgi:hypothetical protein